MKKVWVTALMTVLIAGVATTAIGEGQLRIQIGKDRVNTQMSASDSKTVTDLVEKMGGFVDYNSKTGEVEVIKPNVNLMILEGIQQVKGKNIVFSNPITSYSSKDVPRTFGVFVEVDNAPEDDELKMQIVLIGPNGKEVEGSKVLNYNTKKGTSFYFSEPFVSTKLSQYGEYKVQLRMKSDKFNDYVVVGENTFTVGRN